MKKIVDVFKILFLLASADVCFPRRHSLFWNPSITPELTTKGASAKLRMGDFLDLMCPHTGLASRNKSNFTTTFNVYKVNKDEFEKCRVSDKNKLYFRCNRPNQENKLTLKMQTFSPSPFGFEFDYCTDYYYIAYSLDTVIEDATCNDKPMRFKLQVECKEQNQRLKRIKTRKNDNKIADKHYNIKSINETKIEESRLKTYKRNHHHPKNIIKSFDEQEKTKKNSVQALGVNSSATKSDFSFMKILQLISLLFYTCI